MTESGSSGTIQAVFDLATEAEKKVGDIYRGFSELFSHVPEVSAFWEGLDRDEREHGRTLQELRRSLTPEISQHQQNLVDFKDNFGDRPWRKGIRIYSD